MQVLLQAVSYFDIGHELSVLYVRSLILSKSCYHVYSHTLICREYPMENRWSENLILSRRCQINAVWLFWKLVSISVGSQWYSGDVQNFLFLRNRWIFNKEISPHNKLIIGVPASPSWPLSCYTVLHESIIVFASSVIWGYVCINCLPDCKQSFVYIWYRSKLYSR